MRIFVRFSLALAMLMFAWSSSSTGVVTTAHAASASNKQILQAVNAIRAKHRLPKLQLHPSLQKAAREQSKLMAKADKMSHKVGFRQGFSTRLKRAGYRGLAAENIARGQPTLGRVLSGWMNSRGHRRNMLHPRMRYFGLSVAKGSGRNYWAMVLGG